MRRRIRFLRHFQRMWPRFFQTRDERFIPPAADGAAYGPGLLALPAAADRLIRPGTVDPAC